MDYKSEDIIKDLKNMGLKGTERIMIHSAFSQIKNIDGGAKTLIDTFKSYFKDGLLLFPTHTWASVRSDYDTLIKTDSNSCVGYLTNEVLKDKDFIRSNHPTHSVCAYGKDSEEYIRNDNYATTPVPPNGSFGKLRDGDYILFIGAPLSKNTFIHSIEEEMNVANRFTEHIYTFYVKDENNNILEFHMPRHYSTYSAHISDNYEKLLPVILKNKIAKKVRFLDSTSYLVDSKKLYLFVKDLLKKDIHIFDSSAKI